MVHVVGLDGLTQVQTRFILNSGVSHSDRKAVEDLVKFIRRELNASIPAQVLRAVLRRNYRHNHRGETVGGVSLRPQPIRKSYRSFRR